MNKSPSDAARETPPAGDTGKADAMSRLRAAVTQIISPIAARRPHRRPRPPRPAGGDAGAPGPAPATRLPLGKKSAWTLGGIVVVAGLSVGLSVMSEMSLPPDKTLVTAAAATSAAPPRTSAHAAETMAPLTTRSTGGTRLLWAHPRATGAPASPGEIPRFPSSAARFPSSAARFPSSAAASYRASAVGSRASAPADVTPGLPPATGTKASAAPGASGQPVSMAIPKPVGWWSLGDTDQAMIAQDSAGSHPATGTNAAWCTGAGFGSCAGFNGTSSQFTTSGPVLDTAPGSSFTVAASVFMTKYTGGSQTAVSQDGVNDSGFYLQYTAAYNCWAFVRVVSDTGQGQAEGPTGDWAMSVGSAPPLNTWARLVGVFDASDDQLSLYVNGVLQGAATDTTPFAATGPLAIGRGKFGDQLTDWFDGAIDQVEVFNVALTPAQVARISS